MRRILLFAKVICIFAIFFISASFQNLGRTDDQKWFCEELRNTYQFEVLNSRKPFSVPSNICEIISSNRKKNELVTLQLDENISLKIFPENLIEDKKSVDISQIVYL